VHAPHVHIRIPRGRPRPAESIVATIVAIDIDRIRDRSIANETRVNKFAGALLCEKPNPAGPWQSYRHSCRPVHM
jgi:hypothetical protein